VIVTECIGRGRGRGRGKSNYNTISAAMPPKTFGLHKNPHSQQKY